MGDGKNVIKADYSLVSKEETSIPKNDLQEKLPRFGTRHVQSICLFLSATVLLTTRAHISVTIVAMTDTQTLDANQDNKSSILNSNEINRDSFIIQNNSIHYMNIETNNSESITLGNTITYKNTFPKATQKFLLLSKEDNDTEYKHISDSNFRDYKLYSEKITGWSVYRTYNWSKSTQEMITGSFFIGYSSMQLPMGVISQRFGGKLPLLVALVVNGFISIIIPWAAIIGWWLVCSCRLLQGMTQAALFSGLQNMLGKWAPASERGRLSSYVFTGVQFGTILAFQLAGFLAGSPSFGWPFSFWVSGAMCLASAVIVAYLSAATPAEHPTITAAEKRHIMGHDLNISDEEKLQVKRKTPWRAILTSVPVWAMIAGGVGCAFQFVFLLIETPMYMSKILHVNVKDNGLLSSLPYIAMYITGIASGQVSDFFINRGYVTVCNARRIANTIGIVMSALLMVGFSFATSVPVAVTLLVMSMATFSGVQVGFAINQIDLAPNFAGTLMSLANMAGSFVSLGAPVLVSLLVTDVGNQAQWQKVFLITAAFTIITNVIFVVFVKVEVQPWNDEDQSDDKTSEELQYKKFNKLVHGIADSSDGMKEKESKI